MSGFNGKWTLKEVDNVADFMEAIKSPGEYKKKFATATESATSGDILFEEEFVYDKDADTIQCIIYVNGKQTKDHGARVCNVEVDHTSNDGRPAKLKISVDSDTKITISEKGEDFIIITVMEVSGDKMIATSVGNGVTSTMKYQRS